MEEWFRDIMRLVLLFFVSMATLVLIIKACFSEMSENDFKRLTFPLSLEGAQVRDNYNRKNTNAVTLLNADRKLARYCQIITKITVFP